MSVTWEAEYDPDDRDPHEDPTEDDRRGYADDDSMLEHYRDEWDPDTISD